MVTTAQTAKLQLDQLDVLANRASETVDVKLDEKLMQTTYKFFSAKDNDDAEIRDLLKRSVGLNLALDSLSRLFLLTFLLAGALMFLATWNVPHGEQFVPITLMILGLIGTTLLLLQKQAMKPPLTTGWQ